MFADQLKAVAVNHQLEIVHEANVQFDSDLPEFRYKADDSFLCRCSAVEIIVIKTEATSNSEHRAA